MSNEYVHEHMMSPGERAAYANGHDHRRLEIVDLFKQPSSSTSTGEFLEFLRGVLIRLEAAPVCIAKIDDLCARFEKMRDEIANLESELASRDSYCCPQCEELAHEIDDLKDQLAQYKDELP